MVFWGLFHLDRCSRTYHGYLDDFRIRYLIALFLDNPWTAVLGRRNVQGEDGFRWVKADIEGRLLNGIGEYIPVDVNLYRKMTMMLDGHRPSLAPP